MSAVVERHLDDQSNVEAYRALSIAAVASLVIGVLSVLAVFSWSLGAIPAVGLLLGALAIWRIRRSRGELAGERLAVAGMALSALFWAGGTAWLSYQYAAEVPEGYERITYAQLQPNPSIAGQQFPPSALDLNGKRVFIQGYAYPGKHQTGIREFVLVRDRGTCCFGGPTPKLTDMIQVTLKDSLRLDYALRVISIGGVFRVEPSQASDDLGGVLYHIDADYMK